MYVQNNECKGRGCGCQVWGYPSMKNFLSFLGQKKLGRKIKEKGMWVSSMGVMSVQGMCPHKIYLGTCTCMFKIMNAREGGVGVKYGGTPG